MAEALTFTFLGAIAVAVLLLVPRFLIRPSMSASIQELRDEMFEAQYSGALPFDDSDALKLIDFIDKSSQIVGEITVPRFVFFVLVARKRIAAAATQTPTLAKYTPEQRDLYFSFERRLMFMQMKGMLISSWPSIVLTIVAVPVAAIAIASVIPASVFEEWRTALGLQAQRVAEVQAFEDSEKSGGFGTRLLVRL
jgi:hypothetical protein